MIRCEFTGDRIVKRWNWTCIGKIGTLKHQLIYLPETFCYYLLSTTQNVKVNVVGVSLSHPTFSDQQATNISIIFQSDADLYQLV